MLQLLDTNAYCQFMQNIQHGPYQVSVSIGIGIGNNKFTFIQEYDFKKAFLGFKEEKQGQ